MFSSLDGADAGAIAAGMSTNPWSAEQSSVLVHVEPTGSGEGWRVYLTGEERKDSRVVSASGIPDELHAMGVIHSHKVRWMRALLSLLSQDKAWSVEAGTLHAWSNARASDEAVIKAIRESMRETEAA